MPVRCDVGAISYTTIMPRSGNLRFNAIQTLLTAMLWGLERNTEVTQNKYSVNKFNGA